MSYYSGFLIAVPTANKQAYADHAAKSWPVFQRRGALRMIEAALPPADPLELVEPLGVDLAPYRDRWRREAARVEETA